MNLSLYKTRKLTDLKDMLTQSVELFGSKNAFLLKEKKTGKAKEITYADFQKDVEALGSALLKLGLKDEKIAVIGENRYEWCLTYLTVINGVGVIVPLDKELTLSEIENLLQRSKAAAVIFSNKYAEKIKTIAPSCQSLKYLIHMDTDEDLNGILSLQTIISEGYNLIKQGDPSSISYQTTAIDPDALASLLFTSGTTDAAKGVMLSHRNISSNITSVCATVYIDSSDCSFSILPIHHTYECTLGFLAMLYCGATISFNEGLKQLTKNFKEYQPTVFMSVPLILENIYKKAWDQAKKNKFVKFKLKLGLILSDILLKFKIDLRRKIFHQIHENLGGRVRLILSGAAALDPEVSRWFERIGIQVLQGYGLTECSPLVTGNRDKAFIHGSAGLPIPGVEVKIAGPDENGIGEIITKGANVMLGYFDNREVTGKFIKNGWFHTGDLGYFDKNGFLFITGRSKNVIVTKNGKKIFPEEIEAFINKSPFVKESLIWGKFDHSSGETLVSAQIFPNLDEIKEKFKNISPSPEELTNIIAGVIKNVNVNMPIYKKIRDFTIRESEFIKTTTNKIKRHAVGN